MNERIKELAHQADFIGKKHNLDEWRWGYIDPELNAKLEEFAELIVRECAGLFEIEWGDEKLTGNDVGYVVKKHFGVKL